MGARTPERPFELGDWRVEPSRGVLESRVDKKRVRLEPRLMDLLLLFAASQGRVLSKDEIIANVWSGRAIGDDTLAAAVSRLRNALGETKDNRYIETVPKRGYRFRVDVPSAPHTLAREKDRAEELVRQGETALRTPFGGVQARLYFEAAIAEKPSLSRAHAGLAEALLAQHFSGDVPGALSAAKASAQAAIGLDGTFARAWSTLGFCILLVDRWFGAADETLLRAIGFNPELASAHRYRSFAFASVGRFVEAEREARIGVELEPYSLRGRGNLLQILISARRFQWALVAANETLAMAPQSSEGWYAKGWAHVFLKDQSAGVAAFLRGLECWGLQRERIEAIQHAFDSEGFAAGCSRAADLFEDQSLMFKPRLTDVAILRVAAGQFDAALAALATALTRDDPILLLLPWLPHFDPLRADPRFAALVARIRLVR